LAAEVPVKCDSKYLPWLGVAVGDGLGLALGEGLGDGLPLGEGLGEGLGEALGLGDGEPLGEGLALGEGLGVPLPPAKTPERIVVPPLLIVIVIPFVITGTVSPRSERRRNLPSPPPSRIKFPTGELLTETRKAVPLDKLT